MKKTDLEYRERVKCRAFGHAWDEDAEPITVLGAVFAHKQIARCTRCHTIRVQGLSYNFQVTSTDYQYPEDYKEVSGMERSQAKGWLIEHGSTRRRRKLA